MAHEWLDHFDGHNLVELRNMLLEQITTDPLIGVEGKSLWDNVAKRIKMFDGTVHKRVAWFEDLAALGRFRGAWDPTGGIPTPATGANFTNDPIQPGDYWRASGIGTVAGIGAGSPDFSAGDLVFAETAAAAAPAGFFGVQANVSDQQILHGQEQTITLVANTPLVVTPNPPGKVVSSQFFDDTTNASVYPGVTPAADGSTLSVLSLVAKTLKVRMAVDPA